MKSDQEKSGQGNHVKAENEVKNQDSESSKFKSLCQRRYIYELCYKVVYSRGENGN